MNMPLPHYISMQETNENNDLIVLDQPDIYCISEHETGCFIVDMVFNLQVNF